MQEFYLWGFRGAIVVLFVVLWFWIRRWINQQDERWKNIEPVTAEERGRWEREGGLVTREQYYSWCHNQRDVCPAILGFKILQTWRENAMEKGGVMLKADHTVLCKEITKEVTDKFCDRLDEMLEHHREWVGQELKYLRSELTKTIEK